MNIDKNKFIRKGFVFSKTIVPSVGALLLATQTGCSWLQQKLGIEEPTSLRTEYTIDENCKNQTKHTRGYTTKDGVQYLVVTFDDIKDLFNSGIQVCSDAIKFIMPICGLNQLYEFINNTDDCKEILQGDGKDVIIINTSSEELIAKIHAGIKKLGWDPSNPSYHPSKAQMDSLIKCIKDSYKEIFGDNTKPDFYPSNLTYGEEKCTKISDFKIDDKCFIGKYQRKECMLNKAICLKGPIACTATGSSAPIDRQLFNNQAIIVRTIEKDANGNKKYVIHGVQPNIFLRDYRHSDKSEITQDDLDKITFTLD